MHASIIFDPNTTTTFAPAEISDAARRLATFLTQLHQHTCIFGIFDYQTLARRLDLTEHEIRDAMHELADSGFGHATWDALCVTALPAA